MALFGLGVAGSDECEEDKGRTLLVRGGQGPTFVVRRTKAMPWPRPLARSSPLAPPPRCRTSSGAVKRALIEGLKEGLIEGLKEGAIEGLKRAL